MCLRTWGEGGGIGVYTRNLVRSMLVQESHCEFVLFFQNKSHMGEFQQRDNVTEVHVPTANKLIWDQVSIPLQASRHGVEILFHPKLSVPLAASCKTVMVLHGSERFVYPEFSHRSDILYFKTIYPQFLRRATAIISVSENARRDVVRFLDIDPAKITAIPLAASSYFRPIHDKAKLEQVRQKYALPERFALNVGLIYPGKNLPNLLRALKFVRQDVDIKLVIAGSGRRMFKDDLRLIEDLGLQDAITLPGYIDHEDLVAVYNLAELVAFPSFYESFPAIPLEAQACGCPVVISNTGGSPEPAGDAAVYVDPTDPKGIAAAIVRVASSQELKQDLIEKGYSNVRRFSWERTAKETLGLLESLA